MSDDDRGEEQGSTDEEQTEEPGMEGSARDLQRPIGEYRSSDRTWLSGDEEDDPLREQAAERAARAVEPGRPRE
jgi:hypothetical protein